MKKLFVTLCVAVAFVANAQPLQFGVKGGFNLPNLQVKDNSDLANISTDQGAGFHVGAVLRIKIPGVYIQPELLYTQTNTDYEFSHVNGTLQEDGTYKMQRIDLPIMVGFKLGPAALFAGPVVSFNIDSPNQIFDDSYKTGTWGYQAGVGVKLGKFLLEAKYEGAFHSHAESVEVADVKFDLDTRMHMVIFSAGMFFGD